MQDRECTFDYVRYEENDNDDFKKYYQDNVDPTARPLAINVDYSDALSICYSEIIEVLNGTKDESELPILEKSYYESCKSYLDDPDNATAEQWAAYMSRIKAYEIISNASLREVPSLFSVKPVQCRVTGGSWRNWRTKHIYG